MPVTLYTLFKNKQQPLKTTQNGTVLPSKKATSSKKDSSYFTTVFQKHISTSLAKGEDKN